MKKFTREYLKILNGPLKGLNLTRIDSFDDLYTKQVKDSLEPVNICPEFLNLIKSKMPLVDIGFGGGFPLLPLAYNNPEKICIGLEARKKKSEAVNLIAKELKLNNVKTFHYRVEDVDFDTTCLITLKAVGDISDFLNLISGQAKQFVFFYKGPLLEKKESMKWPVGWKKIIDQKYELEGTEGRRILGFEGVTVPRGTNSNKQLVKVSNLV